MLSSNWLASPFKKLLDCKPFQKRLERKPLATAGSSDATLAAQRFQHNDLIAVVQKQGAGWDI